MKKFLLILLFAASALISRAQTTALEIADDYFAKKDYVKASDYYDKALKADPNNIKALRRQGFCLMNFEGQALNATRFFNQALKLDPKDPASNYYLGVVYMDAAKDPKHKTEKANFKAQAAKYLNLALQYGNEDAKSAIGDLNGI